MLGEDKRVILRNERAVLGDDLLLQRNSYELMNMLGLKETADRLHPIKLYRCRTYGIGSRTGIKILIS